MLCTDRCIFRSGGFGNQMREFGGQLTLSEGCFCGSILKTFTSLSISILIEWSVFWGRVECELDGQRKMCEAPSS